MLAHAWPWLGLLGLGALHGLNPAMGWLFAVALGMQEGSGRAVWRALGPLALGHAVAIAAAVALAGAVGLVLPRRWVVWGVAAALLALGIARLVHHRHVRWGGMRVGARDLAIWSFLMASAHGAGLMALPFVLGAEAHASGPHARHAAMLLGVMPDGASVGLLATAAHSAAYLAVTGAIAVVVYERLGLRLLRTAWVNLDAIWAAALILTAGLTAGAMLLR